MKSRRIAAIGMGITVAATQAAEPFDHVAASRIWAVKDQHRHALALAYG